MENPYLRLQRSTAREPLTEREAEELAIKGAENRQAYLSQVQSLGASPQAASSGDAAGVPAGGADAGNPYLELRAQLEAQAAAVQAGELDPALLVNENGPAEYLAAVESLIK